MNPNGCDATLDQSRFEVKLENTISCQEIAFTSDGLTLKGTLHLPKADRPPLVIGSHGLHSNRHSPKQIALARGCNRFKIAYFRIDHRGCGDSQGEFETVTSLEGRCRDIVAAYETLKALDDFSNRLGLFGSSMGGSVCLMAAGQLPVSAVVSYAAPIRSQDLYSDTMRSHRAKFQNLFFEAPKNQFDISDRLAAIDHILIIHAAADAVVPVAHAREIYKRVKGPKKLIIQKGGDHPMSNPTHQKEFLQEAASWFEKMLVLKPNGRV